jgi:hypothetical protein
MADYSDQDMARLARLVQTVAADPDRIGSLAVEEACAVALLLNRLDLLHEPYSHPMEAFDQLGPSRREMVLDLYNRRGTLDSTMDA